MALVGSSQMSGLCGAVGWRVQQVAGGSRQPVEPRHHKHVARLKRLDHPAKLRPVCLRSAHMYVAEHLAASRLGQLPRLGVNALAFPARRHSRIAVFHKVIMQLIYAAKKPFVFRLLILLRNSSFQKSPREQEAVSETGSPSLAGCRGIQTLARSTLQTKLKRARLVVSFA